jgi:hypothetical protein
MVKIMKKKVNVKSVLIELSLEGNSKNKKLQKKIRKSELKNYQLILKLVDERIGCLNYSNS